MLSAAFAFFAFLLCDVSGIDRNVFGSDGWNRTTDLGTMNPEFPSTVTYKNPQIG
jgi:hypothetical protein